MARRNARLAAEVQRRAGLLRARQTRRWRRAVALAAGACFAAVCLLAVPGGQGAGAGGPIPAGAAATELMGSAGAGGYVLVGVVCFALGIVFTLVCTRAILAGAKKNRGPKEEPGQNRAQNADKGEEE